jgi:ribonuclease E
LARKLLINAQKPEELRIAILEGDRLEAYQVEVGEGGAKRGNIYRGVVTNVQPSLNAAFVDFGDPKNGFLSGGDVVEDAWTRKPKKSTGRARIEDVLEKGKPILVQVQKDMEGKKGSGLTTDISLAGRYLVFTPFDGKIGISRKVEDDTVRQKLREIASGLDIPAGGGLIIRTNALEQTKSTISKDFKALVRLWKKIRADFKKGRGAGILHDDQQIVVRALRDFVDAGITEVLVDTDEAYEIAREYMRVSMPRTKTKLVRYADREPLFSRFRIESQIDAIYDRRVSLASGGSIVVDRTEALTAVDVNSGRSTKAASQEETAYNTNLEAAREIARQLRLRDIGGLIVVDFIDMKSRKHRAAVEKELNEAMKVDRARHTVGRVSVNGLVEINRQRVRKELTLQTHRHCPTCDGTGRIASVEMVGLNLLRRIESRASTTNLERVRIELHPELADAVQNGRRQQISDLEREFGLTVEVIASNRLHRPEQVIDWVLATESAPEPVAKIDVPEVAGAAAEEPAEGTKRRRRKKKKKTTAGGPAADGVEAEPASPEPSAGLEAADLSTTEEASAPKRSRRRRRKKKAGEPTPSEQAEKETAAPLPAEPESAWLFEDPDPEKTEAKPAKRKRRRRKASTRSTAETEGTPSPAEPQPEAAEPPPAPETDAVKESSPAAKKRRPRRRTRRKPSGDSGTSGQGVSSPSDES